MANYTEHYNLEKPEKTDYYDVDTANKNNDIIDNKLYEKQDKQPGKGLSTNDFTNEYKKKIDALQRIYRYCGSVETLDDLNTIEEKQRGDVYNVNDINVDYCWNETEWTELGNAVDLSNYQTTEDAEQMKLSIEAEIDGMQQSIENELANKVNKAELDNYQTNMSNTINELQTNIEVALQKKANIEEVEDAVLDKYSTEEQVVGIWIDGRSIYKKTFIFDIGAHENSIYHTITTMQDAEVINAYGKFGNAFRIIGASAVESDAEITRIYGEPDGRIVFYAGAFSEDVTVYATLEYVKTTD